MSFGIRINIATAALEDIYERLCWVCSTLRNTLVFDHRGVPHNLMYITDLSRGKFPYPEQFSEEPDYEQETLIRDLLLTDILCKRTDWIILGRDPSNLEICQYEDGDEKFISFEGVTCKNPMGRAGCYIRMVQEFSIYLLEPSNRDICEGQEIPLNLYQFMGEDILSQLFRVLR